MKVVLERDELEWIAEIRNCHMGMRAALELRRRRRIDDRELIGKLRKGFRETDRMLTKLGKRGL